MTAAQTDRLLERRLLFLTGKGGVGKTTVAAALAVEAVRRGKRVLLCEVAAQSAYGRIFHNSQVGFEPVEVEPKLWATVCDPQQSLVVFLARFVKVKRIAKALANNRVARRFFDAAPGVIETVVLERIGWFLTHDNPMYGHYDLVIVDLPSSGHAVSFLEVPRSMGRVIAAGALAEHLFELAELLADPDQVELVLVTQPEEMPVRETIELWAEAKERLDVSVRSVIINRVRRSGLSGRSAQMLASLSGDLPHTLAAVCLAATWSVRDRKYVDMIEEALPADFLELPWETNYDDERDLVRQLEHHLREGTRG